MHKPVDEIKRKVIQMIADKRLAFEIKQEDLVANLESGVRVMELKKKNPPKAPIKTPSPTVPRLFYTRTHFSLSPILPSPLFLSHPQPPY